MATARSDHTGDRNWSLAGRALLVSIGVIALASALTACAEEARDAAYASRSGARAGTEANPSRRLASAEFTVEGMTCGGCALATEMAVRKLEGVESVDAEYDESTGEGRCTVEYEPGAVDTDRIAAAIREAGFEPTLAKGSIDR